MSTEANKAVVRNFEEQVWNQRNPGKIGEFFSPNHVFHGPGMTIDFQGHQQMVAHFQSAFPDGVNSSDEMVAEADKVVQRWTFRGTHREPFQGIPATGKKVILTGLALWRSRTARSSRAGTRWTQWACCSSSGLCPPTLHKCKLRSGEAASRTNAGKGRP
jgi:predicted ester cyclase